MSDDNNETKKNENVTKSFRLGTLVPFIQAVADMRIWHSAPTTSFYPYPARPAFSQDDLASVPDYVRPAFILLDLASYLPCLHYARITASSYYPVSTRRSLVPELQSQPGQL